MHKRVWLLITDGFLTTLDLAIFSISYMTFGLLDLLLVFVPLVLGRALYLARQFLRRKNLHRLYLSMPILYSGFLVSLVAIDGLNADSLLAGVGLIPMLINSLEYVEF